MLRRAIVTLMLAGLATAAVADTVYKWVDAQGQVHFTDLPPSESGSKILGKFERIRVSESGQQADSLDSPPPPTESLPPAEDAPSAAAAVQQDLDRERVKQCKEAQDRYQSYITSQRLYRQTVDGKREYLTAEELTAARVQAKQAIAEFCN